jgi:hypothetical protein
MYQMINAMAQGGEVTEGRGSDSLDKRVDGPEY